MSTIVRLAAAALAGAVGVAILIGVVRPSPPPIEAVVAGLRLDPGASRRRSSLPVLSFGPAVLADLRMVGRTPEHHGALVAGAAIGTLTAGVALVLLGAWAGVVAFGPLQVLAVVGLAALAALAQHTSMRSAAAAHRTDLRHQLSAYLDVVTMLLAANVGNEGALRQAAALGDGRFFVELRRRMLSAETANRSLVSALAQLGDDLEIAELQHVAASAALASASGAPVAATLSAKCASLRHTLSAELEADARVRSGRITVPLVGMSLLIMTAVVYPALQFTP